MKLQYHHTSLNEIADLGNDHQWLQKSLGEKLVEKFIMKGSDQ